LCKKQGLCDEHIDPSIVEINLQTSEIDIHEQQSQIRKTVE